MLITPSGSTELAEKVAQAVRQVEELRVVMLDQHGIVAVGSDLLQALIWADLAEEMAQIAFVSSSIRAPSATSSRSSDGQGIGSTNEGISEDSAADSRQ